MPGVGTAGPALLELGVKEEREEGAEVPRDSQKQLEREEEGFEA